MIDWNNPDALMHRGEPIPVNTPEKFAAARSAAVAIYAKANVEFDADAEGDLERRVLNGQTIAEIVTNTLEERQARFP